MKIPAFSKVALMAILAVAGILGFSSEALAQACSVSVSLTAVNAASTACFVPNGKSAVITVTGTWVGTVIIQRSADGGSYWQLHDSTTVNTTFTLEPRPNDVRYRVSVFAYTSGTVTGTIIYNTNTNSKLSYASIPIGSVAYASFGISIIGSATSSGIIDIFVEQPFTSTGAGLLIGATGGTDLVVMALYNSSGALVANTAAAGTTAGTASTLQQIAWVTPTVLPVGRYYMLTQVNGTTATWRRPVNTYIDIVTASLTSVFGTIPVVITPPTTMATSVAVGGTNAIGCVCTVY